MGGKCRLGYDNCCLVTSQRNFLERIEEVILNSSGIPKSGNVVVYGPPGMGRYFLLECLENHLKTGCMNEDGSQDKNKRPEVILIPVPPVIDHSNALVIVLKHLALRLHNFIESMIPEGALAEVERIRPSLVEQLLGMKEGRIAKELSLEELLSFLVKEITKKIRKKTRKERILDENKISRLIFYLPDVIRILLRCEATLSYTAKFFIHDEQNETKQIKSGLKAKIGSKESQTSLLSILGILSSLNGEIGGDYKVSKKILEKELKELTLSFEPFTLSQAIYYLDEVCRLLSYYAEFECKKIVIILGCERLLPDVTEKLLLAIGSVVRFSRFLSFVIACDLQFYLENRIKINPLTRNPLDFTAHVALPYPVLKITEIAEILAREDKSEGKVEEKLHHLLAALVSGGKISIAKNYNFDTLIENLVSKMKNNISSEIERKNLDSEEFIGTIKQTFNELQESLEKVLIGGKTIQSNYEGKLEVHLLRLFLYRFLYLLYIKSSLSLSEISKDETLRQLASLIGKDVHTITLATLGLPHSLLFKNEEIKKRKVFSEPELPIVILDNGNLKLDFEGFIKTKFLEVAKQMEYKSTAKAAFSSDKSHLSEEKA